MQVVANYVAMVPNGKVFDSSLEKGRPYDIRIGTGQVSWLFCIAMCYPLNQQPAHNRTFRSTDTAAFLFRHQCVAQAVR